MSVHSCGDLWRSAPRLTITSRTYTYTPSDCSQSPVYRAKPHDASVLAKPCNLLLEVSLKAAVCLCKWCRMWRALNIDHYVGVCVFCNCAILSLSPSDTLFCRTDTSLAWIRVCKDCDVDLDLERMPWSSSDYLLVFFLCLYESIFLVGNVICWIVNNKKNGSYLLIFLICVGICTLILAEQKRDECVSG